MTGAIKWILIQLIHLRNYIRISIGSEQTVESTVIEQVDQLGPNITGAQLTEVIVRFKSLNYRQKHGLRIILEHALRSEGKRIVHKEDQLLLHIGGEGGTGKSRLIEAVELGLSSLQRWNELMLVASTGSAAAEVHDQTYHSALGLAVHGKKDRPPSNRTQNLWRGKTIMIIDEISIVDAGILARINRQCNSVMPPCDDATVVFGGLSIVILAGDFHQFGPVNAALTWATPKP